MMESVNDIVPPDWQRWSASKPKLLKSLTGGLTNQTYLLTVGSDRVVLRKNSAISAALDLDRASEAEALRLADKAKLCAPLVYCDPGHQYLVTRYVDGQPWRLDRAGALQKLAQLLRSIHELPSIDACLDIDAKVANYWQSIDRRADFYAGLRALDQKIQRNIATAKSLNDGVCLCHNDLSTGNLLFTHADNLYAIDWEYAAMGDRFYDLAVIVEEYRLGKEERQSILSEYLNRPVTQIDWQRLDHWRAIYGYLSVLWYAVQWSTGVMPMLGVNDKIIDSIGYLSGLCPNSNG